MTNGQFVFLQDVKELDDIQQGCLAVRLSIGTKEKRLLLEEQCLARRWVSTESRDDIWSRTIYLTSRGLRSWRIAAVNRGVCTTCHSSRNTRYRPDHGDAEWEQVEHMYWLIVCDDCGHAWQRSE
jgi:hypothetical protein